MPQILPVVLSDAHPERLACQDGPDARPNGPWCFGGRRPDDAPLVEVYPPTRDDGLCQFGVVTTTNETGHQPDHRVVPLATAVDGEPFNGVGQQTGFVPAPRRFGPLLPLRRDGPLVTPFH